MDFTAPSWDLFTVLFLVITVGYGFLMQRERIVVTMVAAYIGVVVSQIVWPELQGFFQGENPLAGQYFIRGDFSQTQIQIGLFAVTTLLVSTKAGIDAERGGGWFSPLELLILSALTGGLILAIVLGYLPSDQQETLADQSRFVWYLVTFRDLWIIAPAVALVALGFRRRKGD